MHSTWDRVVETLERCTRALEVTAELFEAAGNREQALAAADRAAAAHARWELALVLREQLVDHEQASVAVDRAPAIARWELAVLSREGLVGLRGRGGRTEQAAVALRSGSLRGRVRLL